MASALGAQPTHLPQPGSAADMFAGWSGLLVPGISPDYAGVVGYDRTFGRISVLSHAGRFSDVAGGETWGTIRVCLKTLDQTVRPAFQRRRFREGL